MAQAPPPLMFAAADTNFLLGLAANDEGATDALETLKRRAPHVPIAATPTPLEELRYFKTQSVDVELRVAASRALACFKRVWAFRSVSLSSAQQERAQMIGDQIRAKGILPPEERHDSFILAEAALIKAKLLITEDSILRGVDYARLVFELREFNLHPPVLATPREIVHKFFQ